MLARLAGAVAALVAAGFALHLGVAVATTQQAGPPTAEIAFRVIVVSTESRATSVLARLREGADFETLARSESIDPSAAVGGLIGTVPVTEINPEIRGALAVLAPGDAGTIIKVPLGFAIVQRVPVDTRSLFGTAELGGLGAAGSVQPTVSLDGLAEANTVLQQFPKARDWNMSPQGICRARDLSLRQGTQALTDAVAQRLDSATGRPIDFVQSLVALGQLHAYSGRMLDAIAQLERAYSRAHAAVPDALAQLEEMLGVAYLHRAAQVNDVFRRPGDRCLLRPFTTPYAQHRDADKAIEHLAKVVAARPDDYEGRWLLNLAFMTVGGYPARVPPAYLIPPRVFESEAPMAPFVDVAVEAGVESFSSAGGVVVDDLDNDGVLEILTSNFASCGAMQLFRRTPDGRFRDQAAAAGLSGQLGGLNLVQADYDNDGCRDVLVLRGGWETAQRKSLLRNNCDGTFSDVTVAAGLATPPTATQTATWADIDNDGALDLFVGNEDRPAQMFRNLGNGRFEDIAQAAGVARAAFTKAVAAGDIDNDGDVDFFVSNFRGGNFLYRNNGDRTFTDVAARTGATGPDRGFPAWFFDYDNDGWEDLLVTSYYLSVSETVRSKLGLPTSAHTTRLYKNVGGRFEDVTAKARLAKVYMPMGANYGDIDNDGFLDIYFGSGSPSYASTVGSVMLRNDAGRRFLDVTAASGTGELHKGHGVAFGDLDRDGDLDLAFKVGGATPGDAHAFRLFRNPGHGNDWLAVTLVGVRSNRAAIGARITVTVVGADRRPRRVHRTVGSGGSFGASPLEQHIGLGPGAARVDVEVAWPASNTRQFFENVRKNQVIRIQELGNAYETLTRPTVRLGGAPSK